MIVDSSALLAILFAEPDRELYAAAIDAAPSVRLSAVNSSRWRHGSTWGGARPPATPSTT